MVEYAWNKLNHLQIGRYAEYLVKMEFVRHGFDVYTSEVDDRGIDLVVRRDKDTYYDVQVKSLHKGNYIFFQKDNFDPRPNLFAAVVIFYEGEPPHLYLIPSVAWNKPNFLLVNYDYKNRKSKPEWGLSVTKKSQRLLEDFAFELVVRKLKK